MNKQWIAICRYEELLPERPVAALIGRRQVAVVRLDDGSVHAVDNRDPFSRAHVMARGIVGTRGDAAILVSPMHKQAFDLRDGRCLDDPGVRLQVHDVRVARGCVEIAAVDSVTLDSVTLDGVTLDSVTIDSGDTDLGYRATA